MISVRHLFKSYGRQRAVRDVSFDVEAGEVVGFLGPNGAGKTTTIRIIAGFLGANSGSVSVDGHDVAREPLKARAKIGYMPESVPLYPELRVHEYLRYRAELKGIPRKKRREQVLSVMEKVQLADHRDMLIGALSKGYRQRVGLADALLGSPSILILDEPTAGMDPNQIREVRSLIRSLGGRHAVLLSTHIMSEVEATCDRAIIIHRGRLVAQGTIDELREMRQSSSANLVVRGSRNKVSEIIEQTESCASWKISKASSQGDSAPQGDLWRVHVQWSSGASPDAAMETLIEALVASGIKVRQANNRQATLEDVFAALTDSSAEQQSLKTREVESR